MKKVLYIVVVLLIATFAPVSFASAQQGPRIRNMGLTLHVEGNPGFVRSEYSIGIIVYNPADTVCDGNIPGVYEQGNRLVDVVTIVPDGQGTLLSAANGGYSWQYVKEGETDLLQFSCTTRAAGDVPWTSEFASEPYGTYETNLYSISNLQSPLDTAVFATPYKDSEGNPSPIPIKCPVPVSPVDGETILDTTPTFQWITLRKPVDSSIAGIGWGSVVDIIDVSTHTPTVVGYWWVGGAGIPQTISITFPDAPEVPPTSVYKQTVSGFEFPTQLPIGYVAWQMTGTEFFTDASDPRCSVTVPHSNIINVFINAQAEIVQNTLNLASNGKWIQARINLPDGYNAKDVDISSIKINNQIPVDQTAPIEIGDIDANGKSDITVRFDRTAVTALIGGMTDFIAETGKSYVATLSVSGNVANTWFSDSCNVRVLKK
jgi:hypothetical protein